jgi:hypothetical protein
MKGIARMKRLINGLLLPTNPSLPAISASRHRFLSATRQALVLAMMLALTGPWMAKGQEAFDYTPISSPILNATFSVDFAAMVANPTVGPYQVNSVQLWDVQTMTPLDLTSEMFGKAAWPNPPQVDQGPLQTGFVSANIDPSFFPALQSGAVGLSALFTDTADGWFAIDTIELNITTSSGLSTYYYGSAPSGFGIGIPVGGDLPGPLPGSLPYTGTGFDEPVTSKDIFVVTPEVVPEPGTTALFVLGALVVCAITRKCRGGVAFLLLFCLAIGTQAQTSNNVPAIQRDQVAPPDNVDEMGREFAPGDVLIVFKHGTADKDRAASMSKARVKLKEEMKMAGVHHATVHSGQTVKGAVAALRADPLVESASPDYLLNVKDNTYLPVPNDQMYPKQWHLNNNGRPAQRTPGLMHANNIAPMGQYNAGEAIYTDNDASGTVTAGDFRDLPAPGSGLPVGTVAATDADAVVATALIPFNPNEGYTAAIGASSDLLALENVFIASFTFGGAAPPPPLNMDGIYRDVDNSGTVTVNDVRMKSTLGYAPGPGAVNAGDADIGLKLQRFPNAIIDADIDAPQGWRFGTDGRPTVVAVIDSGLDVTHPDIMNNLWTGPGGIHGQNFCGVERHDVTLAPPNTYVSGEGVYLDADGSRTVTVGDTRILPPAGSGLPVNALVRPGDADVTVPPRPLAGFLQTETLPTTFETHTGANMGVGQFLYNDLAAIVRNLAVPVLPAAVSAGDIRLTAVPGTPGAGTTVQAGDADVTPIALVNFQANVKYVDLNGNGSYDNGEPIYNNVGANGIVTVPPDILLSGPAQANGTVLTAFKATERHDTKAGPGPAYVAGDGIYLDADNSGTVTGGDTRITPAAGSGLPAGPVGVDDADVIPRLLHPITVIGPPAGPGTFRHSFAAGSRLYVPGDFIYNLTAPALVPGLPVNGVLPGDTRITATFGGAINTVVAAADADVGLPVEQFQFTTGTFERHTENIAVNGRYDANNTPANEFIYNDIDNSGSVSAGDIRLTAFTIFVPLVGPVVVYAAGSTVMANDVDAPPPTPLAPFVAMETHDTSQGAGDYVAGDGIYVDWDNSGTVTVGDTRITPAAGSGLPGNSPVAPGDADINNILVLFSANPVQKHDTTAGAGVYLGPTSYIAGDGIYLDNDGSGTVTPGDSRILAPASLPALATGTVVAGNADAAQFLVNFATGLQGTDITDFSGHGTSVAGVIGAQGNNATGVSGVCWRAQIMGVKYGTPFASTVISCINWIMQQAAGGGAAAPVPVKIVNMSLGSAALVPAMGTAMNNAMNTGAGMLFTVAAGNEANDNNPQGEPQECIYRAALNNGTLSVGDTRITGYGRPPLNLGPGTVVAAGDEDFIAFTARNALNMALATPRPPYLHRFLPIEKYFDANGNGQYDAGEPIYRDLDGSGTVTANDVRLYMFTAGGNFFTAGPVLATDPDVGRALRNFGANELYHDISQNIGDAVHLANYYDGTLTEFPASFNLPREISVAASDNADNLTGFSSWGTQNVYLAAPGEGILTLQPVALRPANPFRWINGTSFAAPLVAGILDHMWSLPANQNDSPDLIKQELLSDANGAPPLVVAGPHGIDHRYGVRNSVVSGGANHDGRARLDSGDDLGDAPDSYRTTLPNWGARHEDLGDEWLGMDPILGFIYYGTIPFEFQPPNPGGSTPEYDAVNGALWPPDPDGVQNILDMDAADDGIVFVGPFIFSQPPPAAPNQGTVFVYVDTANNDVTDGANGRYPVGNATPLGNSVNVGGLGDGVHGRNNNRNLWVNAWFDWNQNGSFDPGEQVFTLACNPTVFGTFGAAYEVTFNMPVAPAGASTNGQVWARFRLDYGENAGQPIAAAPALPHNVGPSPGGQVQFWDDVAAGGLPFPGGPVANRYESVPVNPLNPPALTLTRGLARYGEVEDYVIQLGNKAGGDEIPFELPDQLHLYGPVANGFPMFVGQTLTAMVENDFVGLPGETVIFTDVIGGLQFSSGSTNADGTQTSLATDFSGSAPVTFFGTVPGPAMIQATVTSTGQSAYFLMQVQGAAAALSMAVVVPGRTVSLQLTGTPNQIYSIRRSTDLKNWVTIATIPAPAGGVIQFTDNSAPPISAFYSAILSQ